MPVITYSAASTSLVAKTRNNRVRLWGGGGGAGNATGNPSGGGGGAGGQFSVARVALAPGTNYTVAVAQAVAAATLGQDTTFASTTVVAKGGALGVSASVNSTSGAGGVATTLLGVGDTVVAGGSGGTGSLGASGGGGGEGGGQTITTGAADTGTDGGVTNGGVDALSDGGDGGAAGITTGNGGAGNPGTGPGGGGGGGRAGSATDRAGGGGAIGQAIVDWLPPAHLMLMGVG